MHGVQVGNVAGLRPLDIAVGTMLGSEPVPLPDVPEGTRPLTVLRDVIARALEPGNCYVSFSGGRDSSGTLALAADVARERGLPLPIPVTLRFPREDNEREGDYQEQIVSHLKLDDWVRIDVLDELELIGPVARRTLRRHGLLFPFASFTMVPLLEAASGGRLMIGMGQSDFFSYWRLSRLADVFLGKRRPNRQDLGPLAYALAPRALRTAMVSRQPMLQMPWLRPEAAREGRRAMARRVSEAPLRYDHAVKVERQHRCHQGSLRCLEATSAVAGTEVVVPYYDAAFHATMSRLGWRGPGGRGSALRAQVGHLLPDHALGRSDSTNFRGVFWGHRTRAFAESWSGRGLNEEMVDSEALRREWLSDEPDLRTGMLMQLAWLADEVSRGEQDQVDAAAPLAGQTRKTRKGSTRMTPDNATPAIEGYESPELWDIGELLELTEHKVHNIADFNGLEPADQHLVFS